MTCTEVTAVARLLGNAANVVRVASAGMPFVSSTFVTVVPVLGVRSKVLMTIIVPDVKMLTVGSATKVLELSEMLDMAEMLLSVTVGRLEDNNDPPLIDGVGVVSTLLDRPPSVSVPTAELGDGDIDVSVLGSKV